MLRKLTNKRGLLGSLFALIMATIIILFILTGFYFVLVPFKSKEVEIIKFSRSNLENSQELISYLNTPLEYESSGVKQQINMQNLISISISNGDFSILKQETDSTLGKLYGKCYSLELKYGGKNEKLAEADLELKEILISIIKKPVAAKITLPNSKITYENYYLTCLRENSIEVCDIKCI
ncbi:MAG: hypothetical protein AABX59_00630 [Nanoarchaeota archaeon]